jgi:outer membrane protein assembly factor BamB
MSPQKILSDSGITGGLVVHLECGDGKLVADMATRGYYLVHGLDKNPGDIFEARSYLLDHDLYGRVQISEFDGKNLPYIDNLVNLLVAEKLGDVSEGEVMRVLAPRGVAIVGKNKIIKKWPHRMKEWTHFLNDSGNNAVSEDEVAGYPRNMQWAASPMWARHHDKQASVSALVTSEGRVYYIVDRGPAHTPFHDARWQLEARDAFNGLLLWDRPMKSWVSHLRGFRSGPVQLARLLVADNGLIFAALGINDPVSVINGADGEVLRELNCTVNSEEIAYHDGFLLVITGNKAAEHSYNSNANFKEKALLAVDPDRGKLLWRYPQEGFADIIPQTLAASDSKVVLQQEGDIICLDVKSGTTAWTRAVFQSTNDKSENAGKKKRRRFSSRQPGWVFSALVIHDGVVLTTDNRKLSALSLEDGDELWSASASTPFGRVPSVDVLIIDDVVWTSPDFAEGRALRSGEVVHKLNKSEIVTAGHHHRCYRNKGVRDFIVYSHRGIDYLDTKGDNHSRNNWVRGTCQYGVMPANGLMYAPPHNCGCYPEAMLRGFWALAPSRSKIKVPAEFKGSLEKGRDYSVSEEEHTRSTSEQWCTYRGDSGRTGVTSVKISDSAKKIWETEIGGDITAPVSACGLVFVASKDTHTVYALDEETGGKVWSYTAGGQVDSPPTIYGDSVLFGAADAHVYSLSLNEGALRWRFDAAPVNLNSVSFGKVESLWPVHGSILVKNDTAYFTAGRNAYLDEGLFLFGLDARSGEVKYSTRLRGEHPGALKNSNNIELKKFVQNATDYKTFEGPDESDAFSMEGNIGDIMLADDDSVYLRHMRFNYKLQRQEKFKHHLFSTSTFVDDNEAHRSHFFYGNGNFRLLPVAYEWITRGSYGGYNVPAAKLMIYDGKTLWGSSLAGQGRSLFAFNVEGLDQLYEKNFPAESKAEAGGQKIWTQKLDIHPRAMIKAGDKIILAGSEQIDQLLGKSDGGILTRVSAESGEMVSTIKLDSVPVFDGMAVANGSLYISFQDGKLVCYR